MDFKEEQQQELEVLESIYPDELNVLCSEYPGIRFSVDLKLDLSPFESSSFTAQSISSEHHLVVDFTLPETYPEVAPIIKIQPVSVALKNDSGDNKEQKGDEDEEEYDEHGNPIISKLENIPDNVRFEEYVEELTETVLGQIERDMLSGIPMCFTLVSSVKDLAESWFPQKLDALEKEHERRLRECEQEEQRKFQGTKVTKESYLEWRKRFRKEFGLDERDNRRRMQAHAGRLSGRQVFEQGLSGEDDLEAGGDEDELSRGIKQL